MKNFLKNANSGIVCLIEIVVGVLLLLNPHELIKYILIIAGAFIALSGIIALIKYFASTPEEGAESGGLCSSLVSLTLGAFLIVNNDLAITAAGIISALFGAAILYTGYQKLQKAVDKMRRKQFFIVALVSALVTVAIAVLILFVIGGDIIWTFMGIALIVEAAIDLAEIITGAVTGKKNDKKSEEAPAIEAQAEEKTEE